MEVTNILAKILEGIPKIIGGARDLLTKLLLAVGLPDNSYTFIAAGIGGLLSYLWIKQYVTSSLWLKLSTILNFVLLTLLFWLVLTRV